MRCASRSRNSGTDGALRDPVGRPRCGAGAVRPPTFADKRRFLESGLPWPDEPPPDCIETHASLVCLTRDRAWKLKKPVRLVHVDQRALADREWLCREEVRLNRALSGDVYLGLTPLVQRPDGALALGAEGAVVDWLIETVRLPRDQMLDRRLVSGPVPTAAEIAALGEVLVGFYGAQPSLRKVGHAFCNRLVREVAIAARHLHQMAGAIGVPPPVTAIEVAKHAVRACRHEILERSAGGVLIEGHGDLRAEHVCLMRPPVVFDRLETDRALRLVDPFFEVTALGLECNLLGGRWIGVQLRHRLAEVIAPPSCRLLSAYGLVASLTKARIAADHFRDTGIAEPERHRSAARSWLEVAMALVEEACTD